MRALADLPDVRRVTVAETLAWGCVASLALLILNSYLLDRLSLPILPWLVVALAPGELLALAAAAGRRVRVVDDLAQLAGFLLAAVGAGLVFLWPSLPSLYPPSVGVDALHHYQLIDYIATQRALPHDFNALAPYLGEMVSYPPGSHLAAAILAGVLEQDALVVMHPFMALIRALTAGLVFLFAYELLPELPGRLPAALAAPLLLFAAPAYFVGALVGQQYYFSMVFAELLIVAFLALLPAYAGRGSHAALALLALLALALLLSYPSWLPLPGLSFAAVWLFRRATVRRRLADAVFFALPLVLLGLLFAAGRTAVGASVLQHEGDAIRPSLQTLDGRFLLLALAGLVLARLQWKRTWPLFLALAATAALGLAFFVAADVLHLAARYHAWKTMHLLIYPLALLGAQTLSVMGRLGSRGRSLLGNTAALAAAVVLTALIVPGGWPSPVRQPLTPDEVRVGRWARENVDVRQVGYRTEFTIGAYWLHVGILGNPRQDWITNSVLELVPITIPEWLDSTTYPAYLLLYNAPELAGVPQEASVRELYRSGQVVLLERAAPGAAPAPAIPYPQQAVLGGAVRVLGYGAASRQLQPGGRLDLTVFWRVEAWPHRAEPLRIYAHLLDERGALLAQIDQEPLGGRYTSLRWPLGVVHQERFALAVPAGLPPGRYTVQVGLYPRAGGADLPVTASNGAPLERLLLGPFKVQLAPAAAAPAAAVSQTFGGVIALLGYDGALRARPGEPLTLRLYWRAEQEMTTDYTAFVHLVGPDGKPLAQHDSQPHGGSYPTSIWEKGEVVAEDYSLGVPAALSPGTYRLRVGWYAWPSLARLAAPGGGDSFDLGAVEIR